MNKDMTLADLLLCFWRAKVYLVIGLLCAALCAFIFLENTIPQYRAFMIVAPADGYALGDYASAIEYDRIASLPFWRPKDHEGASTDFYRFVHTMRGSMAAEILLKDKLVLEGINKKRKKKVKTAAELSVYLERYIKVDPLGATPLRRISYRHADPQFAAALLRKIHLVADQMIRRDRRRQSQSRIDYLQNVLSKTPHPDHRKGITNILMQQEHVQMLANLDEPYAAIVVEPANTRPRPDWPNPLMVWAVALFIGFIGGFLVWSWRDYYKAKTHE